MKLTVKIKLVTTAEEKVALVDVLRRVNEASTFAAKVAREESLFNKFKLQKKVYGELKERFGLGGSFAALASLRASKTYSNWMQRTKAVKFSPVSAIPLDRNVLSYRKSNLVSLWTSTGRMKVPFQCHRDVPLSSKIEAKLVLQDGEFYIHQPVEMEEKPQVQATEFLGVDLGIKNIAVTSDGEVHSGSLLNSLRYRNQRLRSKLQSKGTKSAKRLLRKRRRREQRFATDVNHCISKKIVARARDTLRGVALEDLKNIRERLGRKKTPKKAKQSITVSKPQRAALSRWAFHQLRAFIEYKAKREGVLVRVVSPHYTSQRCSSCGYVHRSNRKTQASFTCRKCGYAGCADYNAACNISYVASGGVRLSPVRGDVPLAASADGGASTASLTRQAKP